MTSISRTRSVFWLIIAASLFASWPSTAQRDLAAADVAAMDKLHRAGNYAQAIPIAQRVVAIYEATYGPNHVKVAWALDNRALLYKSLGRYNEAEQDYNRSLAIYESASNHPEVARALTNLGVVYDEQGRYADAEPLLKRALAIREKSVGINHPDFAHSLNILANCYRGQGRFNEAEPLYLRSLAIREKALGANSIEVAWSLHDLAMLYREQDRLAAAEPPYRRALAIWQKTLGPNHPFVGLVANNLAAIYLEQRRYADAESLFKQSLANSERVYGPNHPEVATSLNNLAELYRNQNRSSEAEPLYKRSLAIREAAFGADGPQMAAPLNNLALLYKQQGRDAEAEALYKRSLSITEKAFGINHPASGNTLNNLVALYNRHGRYADALPLVERAIGMQQVAPSALLPALLGAQQRGLIADAKAVDQALIVAHLSSQTSAASAVQHLAGRLGAGSDRLAQLVRRYQDVIAEFEQVKQGIIVTASGEPSKQNAAAGQRLRERLSTLAGEGDQLNKTIDAEFPDYAALSKPRPLAAAEIQSLLSDDEALVFLSAHEESHVFVFTRQSFAWNTIGISKQALEEKVAGFRRGLDVAAIDRIDGKIDPAQAGKLFDLSLAHELYATLLGPVDTLIKDKKHVIVVPSGPLTALPFHLLVTDAPAAAVPGELSGYRDAAWLIKRQAVSVLPSVASLKILRGFARKDQGGKPLIGFGDPMFDPAEAKLAGKPPAGKDAQKGMQKTASRGAVATRGYADFWQGANIDRAQLTRLPRLPETADELKAVAERLGASASDIHLRGEASESMVKRLPLAQYKVVYFATHGLVAGDVRGLAEPSLALSPPAEPTADDDGLLTASEVAQLKLNADWVVLSACNTIAGDKPGAEALSGLARAFFYAGARALLVSHWSVDSNAATRLTTSTFALLAADPALGRAEALRRAMLAYMSDTANLQNAYPALWAPFVVVGEGARG
jgi:CHAT domain-containing protein/tetratricopeptide (TPR) repeat protein